MSDSLDSRALIDKGNFALSSGDLPNAEQWFVEAHENATDPITRDSASVSLIDSILLPQRRFSETRMWIRSIVSNELRESRKKFLKSSNIETELDRAPKNRDWASVNLNDIWPITENQQTHFNRLIKKMTETVLSTEQRDVYSTWPGPGFTGFVNGIWESAAETFGSLGIQRETVAMAAYDFLNHIIADPLNSEETNPFTLDAPYRNEEESKILDLANSGDAWAMKEIGIRFDRKGNMEEAKSWWERGAKLGNHACMRNLGVIAISSGDKQMALHWYNKALSAGSKTVYQPISECFPKEADEYKDWLLRGAENGDPVALNNLGTMAQSAGDFQSAAKYYRRAAEFDLVTNAANLSQMLCLIGLIDEARVWLERAIENKDSRSAEMIAKVKELIKKHESSKQILNKQSRIDSASFIELDGDAKRESALNLCEEIVLLIEQIDESNGITELIENSEEAEDIILGATIAKGFIDGDISISEMTLTYLQATYDALSELVVSIDSDELEEEE